MSGRSQAEGKGTRGLAYIPHQLRARKDRQEHANPRRARCLRPYTVRDCEHTTLRTAVGSDEARGLGSAMDLHEIPASWDHATVM